MCGSFGSAVRGYIIPVGESHDRKGGNRIRNKVRKTGYE